MLSPDRPPKTKLPPGYAWEYREGCQRVCYVDTCLWFSACRGEDTPHWRQVIVPFEIGK